MTDTGQTEREQAAQFEQLGMAFGDEEGLKARASAEPQQMYVDRAARCPVVRNEDGSVQLLRMEDMLWVKTNLHQASWRWPCPWERRRSPVGPLTCRRWRHIGGHALPGPSRANVRSPIGQGG